MDHFKEERPWPRDITFLFAIVTLLLSVSQCVTLVKFTALPPSLSYIPFDHFLAEVQMQVALRSTDIALLLETDDHRIVTESKLSLLRRTVLLLTGLAWLLILGLWINQEFRNT